MIRPDIRSILISMFLLGALAFTTPALAEGFACADPVDLDPGQTDLVVTKEVDVDEVRPHGELTYTIQVHNCGPEVALNTEFTVELPEGSIFYSAEQKAGPPFTLVLPAVGEILTSSGPFDFAFLSGSVAELAVGETAVFEVVIRLSYR